jgi:hypothetical protein
VRKKYAIDDVMKISYLSLLGVRNDPKLERTPDCLHFATYETEPLQISRPQTWIEATPTARAV